MVELICSGLPASWVNAWLAAVGATQLEPSLKLRWTPDKLPRAVLCAESVPPAKLLAAAWPTGETLKDLPIAETWRGTTPVRRKVSVDAFIARTKAARAADQSWTLSSTITDLHVTADGEVSHAPFDPSGPGTIKWLHHRLLKAHEQVNPTVERLVDSLRGTANRVKGNGLGFDITRLASQADKTANRVDPVIEVLAFFGLALLPFRGTGTDARINKSVRSLACQRGWKRVATDRSGQSFVWPVWTQPLAFYGIDALLDIWNWRDRSDWASVGVYGGWRTVRYQKRGTGDTTRAFGAERL